MKRITILFLINIIASGLLFAQKKERVPTPIGGRPDLKGDLFLDFGFNTLNNKPSELGTEFLPSRTFNAYYQAEIKLGEGSGITLNPGIGYGSDKMAFNNNRNIFNNPSIGPESSQLLPVREVFGDDITIGKNNVSLNYLDVPIEFRYHFNKRNYSKGVRFAFGAKVGYLMSAHTKIEYTDANGLTRRIKDRQSYGLNPFRYGIYSRLGFPGFNIWTYYGLNQVWEKGKGPFATQAGQISFGVSFALF
jgi:hypothetical protein